MTLLLKPVFVAWRVANDRWSKQHIAVEQGWTQCGHEIPAPRPWGGPTYAPIEGGIFNKDKVRDICGTCLTRWKLAYKESH